MTISCLRSFVLKGEELTRREYRQLRTTASDVLKMVPMMIILIIPFMEAALPAIPVPMMIILIIPFMEAALPAILYMFPGLLPSTFQQEWKREDDMKRTLKARIEVARFLQRTIKAPIEVARFLQDAVDQMAGDIKKKAASDTGHDSADEFVAFMKRVQRGDARMDGDIEKAASEIGHDSADEFGAFMKRVQRGDARVTNEEILKFSTLFNDDITLDNIGRPTMTY
ncbi:LETM1-like protein-domain-containing protein [Baffinella frigidus]|nr:LETM1-like protein-domain-containing protein [Cryptophyta sp. CCMP2293]